MKLRSSLLIIIIGMVLSWGGWLYTLFQFSPRAESLQGFFFFYATLWLALVWTVTSISLLWKNFMRPTELSESHIIKQSFLIGIIVGSGVILILALKAQNLLRWWNAPLFVAIIILLTWLIFRPKISQSRPL